MVFYIINFTCGKFVSIIQKRQNSFFSRSCRNFSIYVFMDSAGIHGFTRIPYAQPQYELHLFWSWKAVFLHHDREMLKENILNCLLLLPYGCLVPVTLGRKIGWKEGLLIGFGTSSVIETLQLITCRGLFEFDDIVHNGLGCMLGVLLISWFCQKNINIHEGEN